MEEKYQKQKHMVMQTCSSILGEFGTHNISKPKVGKRTIHEET
jgi:hypothetical protein